MDFLRKMYYESVDKLTDTKEKRLAREQAAERSEQMRREMIGAFKKITETIQHVKARQNVSSKEKRTLQLLLTGYVRGVSRTTGSEYSGYIDDINTVNPQTKKSLAMDMVEALRLTRQIPGFEKLVDEALVSMCSHYDSVAKNPVTAPYYDNGRVRRTPEMAWKAEGALAREAYRKESKYLG